MKEKLNNNNENKSLKICIHSSLSECNVSDLERVQKSALRVISKEKYKDCKNALITLNIES